MLNKMSFRLYKTVRVVPGDSSGAAIRSLELNSLQKFLLVACRDNRLRLLSLPKFTVVRSFSASEKRAFTARAQLQGDFIFCSFGTSIEVLLLANGKPLASFGAVTHRIRVEAMSCNKCGTLVAVCYQDGRLVLYKKKQQTLFDVNLSEPGR